MGSHSSQERGIVAHSPFGEAYTALHYLTHINIPIGIHGANMNIEQAQYVLVTLAKRKEMKRIFGELFEFGPECKGKRIGRAIVHELIAREMNEVVNNDFCNNLKTVLEGYLVRATKSRGKQYYSGIRVRKLADRQELEEAYNTHDSTVRHQTPYNPEQFMQPGVKAAIAKIDGENNE